MGIQVGRGRGGKVKVSSIKRLKIKDLKLDGGTQPRAAVNEDLVREYAAEMANGADFPPVKVFFDGTAYWLADGFHRVKGALKAGMEHIKAEVVKGSVRDAILYAVGANAAHGMRRTNEDKHCAVGKLLADKEWRKWSDSKIARQCGVSVTLVGSVRKELGDSQKTERLVERNGVMYPMKTENIGLAPKGNDGSVGAVELSAKSRTETGSEPPVEKTAGQAVDARSNEGDGAPVAQAPAAEPVAPPQPASPEAGGPPPSPENWAKWSWVSIAAGAADKDDANAILVVLPGTTAVNKNLRAFVEHACKLNCNVFATPSLQELATGN